MIKLNKSLKKKDIKYFGRNSEAQAIFLNSFTVCSSCKRKFVVFTSVDEETNGSYPFANGLNGLDMHVICCYCRHVGMYTVQYLL
jgi:hypothetical protein